MNTRLAGNFFETALHVYYQGFTAGFLFGLAAGIEFILTALLLINAWKARRKKNGR